MIHFGQLGWNLSWILLKHGFNNIDLQLVLVWIVRKLGSKPRCLLHMEVIQVEEEDQILEIISNITCPRWTLLLVSPSSMVSRYLSLFFAVNFIWVCVSLSRSGGIHWGFWFLFFECYQFCSGCFRNVYNVGLWHLFYMFFFLNSVAVLWIGLRFILFEFFD